MARRLGLFVRMLISLMRTHMYIYFARCVAVSPALIVSIPIIRASAAALPILSQCR
jgi:hypothetical protein